LLTLFNFNIAFNPSKDFSRCVLLAHITSGVLLLLSSLHPLLITVSLVLLVVSQQSNHHVAGPHPQYKILSCNKQFWVLEYQDSRQIKYNSVHINFDGGFFLLLLLTEKNAKKRILLFNDQITSDQHRQLKVLSRIS